MSGVEIIIMNLPRARNFGIPTIIAAILLIAGSVTNGSDYAQSVITLANLQIQQISSTNFSGNFQVIITNNFGSVTSSVATLKYSSASGINPGGG